MEDNIIEIINSKGQKEKIEILKYFKLNLNQKDYIIYKSAGLSSKEYSLYAAEIYEDNNDIILTPIIEKAILNEIEKIMRGMKNG